MNPFWAGAGGPITQAGIGLVGNLADKVFGDSGMSQRDAAYFARDMARNDHKWYTARFGRDLKRKAADSGLHPLALLGAPSSGGTLRTPSGSTESGSVWSDGAANIGRAAGAAVDAWLNRENAEKQNQLLDAQIERMRAETDSIIAQSQPAFQPVLGAGRGDSSPVVAEALGLPTPFEEIRRLPFDRHGRYYVPLPNGGTFYPDPNVAPAEVMQTLMGDVAEEGYGLAYGIHHGKQLEDWFRDNIEVRKTDSFSWLPKFEINWE